MGWSLSNYGQTGQRKEAPVVVACLTARHRIIRRRRKQLISWGTQRFLYIFLSLTGVFPACWADTPSCVCFGCRDWRGGHACVALSIQSYESSQQKCTRLYSTDIQENGELHMYGHLSVPCNLSRRRMGCRNIEMGISV